MTAERKEGMAGLAKGLSIIEGFSPTRRRLSISDAAKVAATSPASARRCLRTLEELGFLAFDGKYYHPTPRLTRLSVAYTDMPFPRLAEEHLEAVRDHTGKSASLAVLEDAHSLFVARAETEQVVSAAVRVGSRLPAHRSSTGRVLLAGLAPDDLEANLAMLLDRSAGEIGSEAPAVRRRVADAREAGYSFTDEELEQGVRTVAVPVIDGRGVVRAAMSVSAFAHLFTVADLLRDDLPVLQREAQRFGRKL